LCRPPGWASPSRSIWSCSPPGRTRCHAVFLRRLGHTMFLTLNSVCSQSFWVGQSCWEW
jgi:hypothetical protein